MTEADKVLGKNKRVGYAVQIEWKAGEWYFATDAYDQMVISPTKKLAEIFLKELVHPPDIELKDLTMTIVKVEVIVHA